MKTQDLIDAEAEVKAAAEQILYHLYYLTGQMVRLMQHPNQQDETCEPLRMRSGDFSLNQYQRLDDQYSRLAVALAAVELHQNRAEIALDEREEARMDQDIPERTGVEL